MSCPFCRDLRDADRRTLHAHLCKVHGDAVAVGLDQDKDRMYYQLTCPKCEYVVSRTVRPRSTDEQFLQEYRAEIALVAFDLLLYHLDLAHAAEGGPKTYEARLS